VGLLIERPDNFLNLPRTRALPELSSWLAVAGGTSYAVAHVTGLSALLWARCPTKSALEIRNLIINAVEKKSAFAGKVASAGGCAGRKASLVRNPRFRAIVIFDLTP
jgi:hypothetical protein